jgi:hypothetical protein
MESSREHFPRTYHRYLTPFPYNYVTLLRTNNIAFTEEFHLLGRDAVCLLFEHTR